MEIKDFMNQKENFTFLILYISIFVTLLIWTIVYVYKSGPAQVKIHQDKISNNGSKTGSKKSTPTSISSNHQMITRSSKKRSNSNLESVETQNSVQMNISPKKLPYEPRNSKTKKL